MPGLFLPFLCLHGDLKIAVKRIVGAKWGPCSGQVCIGIDYVLVEEKFSGILVTDYFNHVITNFVVLR